MTARHRGLEAGVCTSVDWRLEARLNEGVAPPRGGERRTNLAVEGAEKKLAQRGGASARTVGAMAHR
eukprot:6438435-Prymnesium_polylepis.2